MIQLACAVSLVMFVCSGSSIESTGNNDENTAISKRDTTTSLFPFPRVGRSHTNFPITWGFYSYDDKLKRREGLIPFPRIGRSEAKRNGAGGSGALWFGPRLGKMQKRMWSPFIGPFMENVQAYAAEEDADDAYLLKRLKLSDEFAQMPVETKRDFKDMIVHGP